jgi:hypothetical protein
MRMGIGKGKRKRKRKGEREKRREMNGLFLRNISYSQSSCF